MDSNYLKYQKYKLKYILLKENEPYYNFLKEKGYSIINFNKDNTLRLNHTSYTINNRNKDNLFGILLFTDVNINIIFNKKDNDFLAFLDNSLLNKYYDIVKKIKFNPKYSSLFFNHYENYNYSDKNILVIENCKDDRMKSIRIYLENDNYKTNIFNNNSSEYHNILNKLKSKFSNKSNFKNYSINQDFLSELTKESLESIIDRLECLFFNFVLFNYFNYINIYHNVNLTDPFKYKNNYQYEKYKCSDNNVKIGLLPNNEFYYIKKKNKMNDEQMNKLILNFTNLYINIIFTLKSYYIFKYNINFNYDDYVKMFNFGDLDNKLINNFQ